MARRGPGAGAAMALAVVVATCAASTVSAQTLTLSGGIAVGLKREANGAQAVQQVASLATTGNYLNIAAVDELGAGWRSGVTLTARFQPDTGNTDGGADRAFQTSKLWVSGPWGELGMGRFNAPTDILRARGDLFYSAGAAAGVFGHPADVTLRYGGMVQISTPVVNHVKAVFAVADRAANTAYPSSVPGVLVPAARANIREITLEYTNGPQAAGLGFTENPNGVPGVRAITAVWRQPLGSALLGVVHTGLQRSNGLDAQRTSAHVNLPLAPGWVGKAGVERQRTDGQGAVTGLALGVDRVLSPRTRLIADAWRKSSRSTTRASDGGISYALGIRHTF